MLDKDMVEVQNQLRQKQPGVTQATYQTSLDNIQKCKDKYTELPLEPVKLEGTEKDPFIAARVQDTTFLEDLDDEEQAILDTKALGIDQIPDFSGEPGSKVAVETFVREVENHKQMRKWSDRQAAKVAAAKMKTGEAADFKMMLEDDEDQDINSWSRLKLRILTRFQPASTYAKKAEILKNVQQGPLSVQAYWGRCNYAFQQVYNVLATQKDKDGNIKWKDVRDYTRTLMFLIGLNPDISTKVVLANAKTPSEVVDAAIRVETSFLQHEAATGKPIGANSVAAVASTTTQNATETKETPQVNAVAAYHGNPPRGGSRGRGGNRGSRRGGRGGRGGAYRQAPPTTPCTFCQKMGHWERDCFAKQRMKQVYSQQQQQRSSQPPGQPPHVRNINAVFETLPQLMGPPGNDTRLPQDPPPGYYNSPMPTTPSTQPTGELRGEEFTNQSTTWN
ncbi:uncharacterized protein LOC113696811 [Paramuricea clavata]|uniref:Uncharacterized protein LOC113696811 n=1 Tax=Paramuricea clavata TaxID=317549 RepID=A0A7D9KJT0_PARCT|nr:uncharacterized protein LOC113696811 [Paramuricea clavata]